MIYLQETILFFLELFESSFMEESEIMRYSFSNLSFAKTLYILVYFIQVNMSLFDAINMIKYFLVYKDISLQFCMLSVNVEYFFHQTL